MGKAESLDLLIDARFVVWVPALEKYARPSSLA